MSVTITKDNFSEVVLNSPVPVLADFWAEWCPPCKMIAPILDEIAAEYEGKICVAKINVDDNQELAQQYEIASIPTLLLFSNKEIVQKQIGAVPKDSIVGMFKEHIAS